MRNQKEKKRTCWTGCSRRTQKQAIGKWRLRTQISRLFWRETMSAMVCQLPRVFPGASCFTIFTMATKQLWRKQLQMVTSMKLQTKVAKSCMPSIQWRKGREKIKDSFLAGNTLPSSPNKMMQHWRIASHLQSSQKTAWLAVKCHEKNKIWPAKIIEDVFEAKLW